MDRDKQSSKHAWCDPNKQVVDGWMASRRSVILVQLLDDSSLAGNGNRNCSSRFSSSSSCLGSAPNCGFRRITCSAASRGPRRYSSCAAKVIVPHLSVCWHSTLRRNQQHSILDSGLQMPFDRAIGRGFYQGYLRALKIKNCIAEESSSNSDEYLL